MFLFFKEQRSMFRRASTGSDKRVAREPPRGGTSTRLSKGGVGDGKSLDLDTWSLVLVACFREKKKGEISCNAGHQSNSAYLVRGCLF